MEEVWEKNRNDAKFKWASEMSDELPYLFPELDLPIQFKIYSMNEKYITGSCSITFSDTPPHTEPTEAEIKVMINFDATKPSPLFTHMIKNYCKRNDIPYNLRTCTLAVMIHELGHVAFWYGLRKLPPEQHRRYTSIVGVNSESLDAAYPNKTIDSTRYGRSPYRTLNLVEAHADQFMYANLRYAYQELKNILSLD